MPLTLTRKEGESIDIDGPAVVTVTRIGGNRVMLTVTAEADVKILRTELRGVPEDDDTDEYLSPDLGDPGA